MRRKLLQQHQSLQDTLVQLKMSPYLGLVVILFCTFLVGIESASPNRNRQYPAQQQKQYGVRTYGASGSSQSFGPPTVPEFPQMSFDNTFSSSQFGPFSTGEFFPLGPPPSSSGGGCSLGCGSFNVLAGTSKDRFSNN
ncbi:uncharacterized protein LOC120285359 [Drosophila simulans]|uniref:uncharacterized protein LOC120285359 n=1 Tax=Drosophila simulans TaxID=7240 RepID=UPI00192D1A64|nr:uncharacterized protein LOC120285359 [Drosophila simulans]